MAEMKIENNIKGSKCNLSTEVCSSVVSRRLMQLYGSFQINLMDRYGKLSDDRDQINSFKD